GDVGVAPDLLLELAAKLVRVVVAHPGRAGDRRQLVVPELVCLLRPHRVHATTVSLKVAESGSDDPGKAGGCCRRSCEADAADCIILGYFVGSAVRIVKSKISSAKMNQNLRGYGLVEIQPDGVTVDLLVAPAGYRNWKTIRGRYLRGVLH